MKALAIVAGITMILSGLFNGCSGVIFFTAGGLTNLGASATKVVGEAAIDDTAKGAKEMGADGKLTDEAVAKSKSGLNEGVEHMEDIGSKTMQLGLFLILILGFQMAGAVVLLQQKAPKFAIVTGLVAIGGVVLALGMAGDIVDTIKAQGGELQSNMPEGLWIGAGIASGVLAIAAAISYMIKKPEVPAQPAPAEPAVTDPS